MTMKSMLGASLAAQAVEPVDHLPNPYETVRNRGSFPDGRVSSP